MFKYEGWVVLLIWIKGLKELRVKESKFKPYWKKKILTFAYKKIGWNII